MLLVINWLGVVIMFFIGTFCVMIVGKAASDCLMIRGNLLHAQIVCVSEVW